MKDLFSWIGVENVLESTQVRSCNVNIGVGGFVQNSRLWTPSLGTDNCQNLTTKDTYSVEVI
jgi:hypothetical protein